MDEVALGLRKDSNPKPPSFKQTEVELKLENKLNLGGERQRYWDGPFSHPLSLYITHTRTHSFTISLSLTQFLFVPH